MQRIVLLSCVSKKLDTKSRARDLYVSPLFRYALKYAESLDTDKIFILSAKYGLVGLDEEIEPYELTLNGMKSIEKKVWADDVLKQLASESDLDNDEFVFLAGENYRKYIVPHIKNYNVPMQGLGIGKQLKFLKDKTR